MAASAARYGLRLPVLEPPTAPCSPCRAALGPRCRASRFCAVAQSTPYSRPHDAARLRRGFAASGRPFLRSGKATPGPVMPVPRYARPLRGFRCFARLASGRGALPPNCRTPAWAGSGRRSPTLPTVGSPQPGARRAGGAPFTSFTEPPASRLPHGGCAPVAGGAGCPAETTATAACRWAG